MVLNSSYNYEQEYWEYGYLNSDQYKSFRKNGMKSIYNLKNFCTILKSQNISIWIKQEKSLSSPGQGKINELFKSCYNLDWLTYSLNGKFPLHIKIL